MKHQFKKKTKSIGRPSMVASITFYTRKTISSKFQVSSTTALETSSFEVTYTNKGKIRPLLLEEEELEEKEDEVEEEEKEEDVEEDPIPFQNKRRGSKNKKKH